MTHFNRRSFLTLAASAALLPTVATAQDTETSGWDKDFQTFLAAAMSKTHTPGLSVAIVRKGQTLLVRGYGLADIASGRPVTADTAFHIASVSKTVTGTAMMMLLQDDKFRLDDPINKYLDFRVVHPKFPDTPLTFRQLMTHTSGISDQVYSKTDAFAVTGDPALPLRDFLVGYLTPGGKWYSADGCFGAAPGAEWGYSNVGVALLGYLAGRFGKDLKTLTQSRLFDPLGMHTTSWTYAGLPPQGVATPYNASGSAPVALPQTGYPDWPAGLLRTSARDFARFLAVYTMQGTLDGHAYLKPETLKTLLRPDPITVGEKRAGIRQALIWELRDFNDYHLASHGGGDPGASTAAAIDLDRQTAVLAFTNAGGHPECRAFLKEVVIRLLERARKS
ncbi:MAG: serine hydrolase domain-containing protein [Isosphaeraceae bacterium]